MWMKLLNLYIQLFSMEYITNYGISQSSIEGGCYELEEQKNDIINIIKSPDVLNVLEIGFNAGSSADIILANNLNTNLVSFDIGFHDYISLAEKYINEKYPNRHKLIIGDSTKTIPEFETDIKFDVIFIDGGHEYDTVIADLRNCKRFAHENTIVMLDDYSPNYDACYTVGPTRAWNEFIQNNEIKEINRKEYRLARGMVWGNYII